MVRRQPGGHDVKRPVVEVEVLSASSLEPRVGDPGFREEVRGRPQHAIRRIRHDHPRYQRGESQRGVPGAGPDVEDDVRWARCDQLGELFELLTLAVFTPHVLVGGAIPSGRVARHRVSLARCLR